MKKRNGNDLISIVCYIFAAILFIISLFISYPYFFITAGIALPFFIYGIFRNLSTNVEKRQNEAQRFAFFFLKLIGKDMSMYQKPQKMKVKTVKVTLIKDDHAHVLAECPYCSKKIRLPNKKGKHGVDCPNCHQHFQVKI